MKRFAQGCLASLLFTYPPSLAWAASPASEQPPASATASFTQNGAASAASTAPPDAQPTCATLSSPIPASILVHIYVACGASGIDLGQAEHFTSSYHKGARTTVVEAELAGKIQVYVVSPTSTGAYHVDEISRDLARAAGFDGDDLLPSGTSIDIGSFATTGNVVITPSTDKGSRSTRMVSGQSSHNILTYADLAKRPASSSNAK